MLQAVNFTGVHETSVSVFEKWMPPSDQLDHSICYNCDLIPAYGIPNLSSINMAIMKLVHY